MAEEIRLNKEEKKELIYQWAFKKAFFYPTAEIYGSLAGFYDYGSIGTLLKRNWENIWRNYFLSEENFWEIEGNFILPEKVLIASGHVANFNDPLTECKKCKERFRADHLIEEKLNINAEKLTNTEMSELIKKRNISCPNCGGELGEVKTFGLMFDLKVGPINDKDKIKDLIQLIEKENIELAKKIVKEINEIQEKINMAYLRPETAQMPYLNFKREFEAHRQKLPLGLAIIGKAFRNEISPRQGLFRLREFTQAELQIFFDPELINELKKEELKEWEELKISYLNSENNEEGVLKFYEFIKKFELPSFYAYYLGKMYNFFKNVIGLKRIRVRKLSEEEKAFYNKIHFDFEFYFESLGSWKEIAGLHYRTDHDLGNHSKHSGVDLSVNINGRKFIPHVLEISLGVDRNILAVIDNYLTKEKIVENGKESERVVFKVKRELSPLKVAIFPLLKNKEELVNKAKEVYNLLKKSFNNYSFKIIYDEKGSIGKRYRRQDEIGTPYCITIDFETLEDNTITIRDRDSMKQERIKIEELVNYLKEKF